MNVQRIAIVTGASSGFGMLTSIELAKNGYHVVATMRDLTKQSALLETAAQHQLKGNVTCMRLDVTDQPSITEAVDEVIKQFGKIDILINNAGMSLGGFVEEVAMEHWQNCIQVNFLGVVAVTQAVLPHMRSQKKGTIINVSSVSGRVGFPGFGPYSASKFALEGFSESLRLEMLPYGVHVAVIEPGAYKTDIWSKAFHHVHTHAKERSPYESSLTKIFAYCEKLTQRASDPQDIAELIVKISNAKQPKFRTVVGRGSNIAIIGKALLPWRWFEKIILQQLKK